jgi:type III pantothenate kinase
MLLLDVGNSAIKGQWWCDGELHSSFTCRRSDNWQARFIATLSEINATQCHYASVADLALEEQLLDCLNQFFPINAQFRLRAQKSFAGVRNGYEKPECLGVDRWLALIGAADFAPVDKLIVDAGSAITIDLLCKNGDHLGGAILPGFNTSIDRFKNIMSKANFNHPDIANITEPGCSTEACIQLNSGARLTVESKVAKLIGSWFQRLDANALLIVAGGDAELIKRHGRYPRYEIPDLVFRGMRKQLDNQE